MNAKKKIIWHLPYGIIGGVETLYAVILKYIDSEKYEHIITCHTLIQEWCIRKYRGLAKVYSFKDVDELEGILTILQPDLIMGTHGRILYDAMERLMNPPAIIEIVHGSHTWVEHNIHMPKKWTKHIVCVSKTAEKTHLDNSNDGIPTSVIINGVDTEVFYPRKELSRQASVVGYMGRFLECDKHITKVIKAFKSLSDARSRLYLIGGTPQEIVRLRHFSKGLNIERKIKFFGHTEKPEESHLQFDLATVRSEAEGYCNFAAEALASGVPLVCYNFGGILDHVPKGAIAVAKTQQEYASLLKNVFNNYETRKRMRRLGLQFIKNEGSAEVMVKRYEELLTRFFASDDAIPMKSLQQVNKIKVKPQEIYVAIDGLGDVKVINNSPIVGVCNTTWHGIAGATRNCTDVIVPTGPDPKIVIKKIIGHNPRGVLISGMGGGFERIVEVLHKQYPEIPVYAYYHGGVSHYSFSRGLFGDGERQAFQKVIDLHKKGMIKRIAVSSPGLAEFLVAGGIDAYFCGNIMSGLDVPDGVNPLRGINIGNWNRHHDHKHTSVGLAAGQLIEGAITHCLSGHPVIPGLNLKNIKAYPEMPQSVLFRRYMEMQVNLQLSFIETFNISVLEMWACGRPVVLGPGNSVLLKDNPALKQLAYVEDHTNPYEVAKAIQRAARNDKKIIGLQHMQLDKLNRESKQRWSAFYDQ